MKKEHEAEAMSVAQTIAYGIAIMLVFLGIGGCAMLGQSKVELRYDNIEAKPVSDLSSSVPICG